MRSHAGPTRELTDAARVRTLAEADRRRLEASRQTRDLDDPASARTSARRRTEPERPKRPAATRAPAAPQPDPGPTSAPTRPARRPAEPEKPKRPSATKATAAQESDPAWPPTGARLAWPPTGPTQGRRAARQVSADVSTSHLGTEDSVRMPEPSPPATRQGVPSQAVVEPARPVRPVAGPVRTAEPTHAGPATQEALRGGAVGAERASGGDLSVEPAPADPEPPADGATGDRWTLFADKSVAKPKRPARQHRARTFVVMTVVLAMVVGVGYVVATSFNFLGGGSGVSDYSGEGEGSVDVMVRRGDSGAAIAATLHDADVIATEKAFVDECRASSDCQSIQPGTYALKKHMSAAAALAALLNPQNLKSGRLTIAEGKTAAQIVEQISTKTGIPAADLNAAIADPASIGLPTEADGKVEGWLYATTYDIDPDATAVQVLTKMVDKTKEVLTAKGVAQADWQQVLTAASIVEREGGINTETQEDYRPMVARAIQNRLDIGKALEVDATTIYGNPDPNTSISEKNKDASNPYNTYLHTGLPPTPIASPGEVSIDAVLNPAAGDWIYWVTINYETKETRFAATYPEHQQNVALLRDWYNEHQQTDAGQ